MHPRTWLRVTMRVRDLAVVVLITAICLLPALSYPSEWLKNNHGAIHSKIEEEVADAIPANMRESKRNLWNFHKMISCGTNRNSLHYLPYGCWCGLGGTGNPRDAVDRCCFAHDVCYNDLICSKKCGWPYKLTVYLRTYTTKSCTTCSPASSYWWWVWYKECRVELCKCDSEAVKCLARNDHEYNDLYKNTDKKQHCKEQETPPEYRLHC